MTDDPHAPLTRADLTAAETRITETITAAIAASEARAAEHARDLQTEILKGLEAFARGNFSRMNALETRARTVDSNLNDANTRLAALEERVLYLETRRPPQ